MNCRLCATLTLLFLGAPTARAEEGGSNFLSVRAGAVLPRDQRRDFGTGFAVEAAATRQFYPFLHGELAVGYFRTVSGITDVAPYPDPATFNAYIPLKQTASVVPVTISVKGVLPDGSFQPFISAGAGLYIVALEDDPTDSARATRRDSASPFGYHFGLGANLLLGGNLVASIEGRYLVLSQATFFRGDQPSLSQIHLAAGIGYRF